MMTVAAVDRVILHAYIVEIEGENYRKKTALERLSDYHSTGYLNGRQIGQDS